MNYSKLNLSAFVFTSFMLISFAALPVSEDPSEVSIGNQIWMTKNLDVDHFQNGNPIPQAKTMMEWWKAGHDKKPVWSYYNYEAANGPQYGKIYNWYAVTDKRGLAPKGWHIPSNDELNALINYVTTHGGKDLKSTSGWSDNSNGTNSTGFSGLPGGACGSGGDFGGLGKVGVWWTATAYDESLVWQLRLTQTNNVFPDHGGSKECGFSVRCIKN